MSEASLRPDLKNGPYPQLAERWPGLLEALFSRAAGRLRDALTVTSRGAEREVAAVAQRGEMLSRLSDEELNAAIHAQKDELTLRGLVQASVLDSLALVREVSTRVLGKRQYDVQVQGALAMLNGDLVEMATGEGKTLTAALATCTAAMAGIPVHVMTANDYLGERDRAILLPLYNALGLSSAVIQERSDAGDRIAAYRTDVVHATSQQFAFDYLRDRIACHGTSGRLQMMHLMSRDVLWQKPPAIRMRGLCFALVDEADSLLIDEARTPLVISQTRDGEADSDYFIEILAFADGLDAGTEYLVDERRGSVSLTAAGQAKIADHSEIRGRYWLRKERDAAVLLALRALHLLHRNRDYLLRDDSIEIIDPMTGRPMPDRSWENGLHQFVEAKEGCEITPQRDALAKITYQAFFRRYLRLAGMSGTLRESADEIGKVYERKVIKIPRHKPSRHRGVELAVYTSNAARREAFLKDLKSKRSAGRPVLIGTHTVALSDKVSDWLHEAGIDHQLLNARQNRDEAMIVAGGGRSGSVIIATNMAGRGTDIPLGPGVAELGGLHVINLALNESARIDRQLYGRAGRQGDPGSASCFLSLQDPELSAVAPAWIARFAINQRLPRWLAKVLVRTRQSASDRRACRQRLALIDYRRRRRQALSFAGHAE